MILSGPKVGQRPVAAAVSACILVGLEQAPGVEGDYVFPTTPCACEPTTPATCDEGTTFCTTYDDDEVAALLDDQLESFTARKMSAGWSETVDRVNAYVDNALRHPLDARPTAITITIDPASGVVTSEVYRTIVPDLDPASRSAMAGFSALSRKMTQDMYGSAQLPAAFLHPVRHDSGVEPEAETKPKVEMIQSGSFVVDAEAPISPRKKES